MIEVREDQKRLVSIGAEALTETEVLATLLSPSALSLKPIEKAAALLEACGPRLAHLARRPLAELARIVGRSGAARIAAGLELGRRVQEEGLGEHFRIRSPSDVYRLLAPRMATLVQEEFHVIALDSQSAVLRDALITRGILNSSLVHPREVFRQAIAEAAAGVILAHNHPSGDPTPSADDRAVTRQLVEAGRLLDLPVYDHVVIGDGRYASFVESGLL